MEKIKKNYKIVNIIVIALAIYIFIYPLIANILEIILPNSTECVYLRLTGEMCPLCGGTRYIANIGKAFKNITYLFNFFGFIAFIALLEIIFRIVNIYKINNEKYIKKVIEKDIIIHVVLATVFITYEITFLICNK